MSRENTTEKNGFHVNEVEQEVSEKELFDKMKKIAISKMDHSMGQFTNAIGTKKTKDDVEAILEKCGEQDTVSGKIQVILEHSESFNDFLFFFHIIVSFDEHTKLQKMRILSQIQSLF